MLNLVEFVFGFDFVRKSNGSLVIFDYGKRAFEIFALQLLVRLLSALLVDKSVLPFDFGIDILIDTLAQCCILVCVGFLTSEDINALALDCVRQVIGFRREKRIFLFNISKGAPLLCRALFERFDFADVLLDQGKKVIPFRR